MPPRTPTLLDTPLFSADSHVIESPNLWAGIVPADFWPDGGAVFKKRPGGHDPEARLEEMAVDGVDAEVLYPTLALKLFGLDDPDVQAEAMRTYNDWLVKYSMVAPDALVGIAAIPAYDIEIAVAELRRCHRAGLRGCMLWQTPHPDLPYSGDHYEAFWREAAALRMPVSFHILTGHDFSKRAMDQSEADITKSGARVFRQAVNLKLLAVTDLLHNLVFSGVLDRHPGLQLVLVENEAGWLPFVLDQWDYYATRFTEIAAIQEAPSTYFDRQISVTFFRDPVAARCFSWWGQERAMWSSDYPHGNSTWPDSRSVVASLLGDLPASVQHQLVRGNVERLYGMAR